MRTPVGSNHSRRRLAGTFSRRHHIAARGAVASALGQFEAGETDETSEPELFPTRLRTWHIMIGVCFVLGAGAALGIATKLGAFGDKSAAPNIPGTRGAP